MLTVRDFASGGVSGSGSGISGSAVLRQRVLSDAIIPAEPGEFYSYSSEFTVGRPIFALLKCKSNKNRPVEQLHYLGLEANILFEFIDSITARASSVRSLCSSALLSCPELKESFVDTLLGSPKITADEFRATQSRRDVGKLVSMCKTACSVRRETVELYHGSVVAVMTGDGKFGAFLVRNLGSSSMWIDACHILL